MCDDVPRLLANSDLFVCSSVSEAGPITVYEAMSMKLPVVTTDVGASRQIIDNFKNGIIVPIKNSKEISYAIERILNNEFLRENIASNAYKFANDFFSLDKIIKQYIEFYNK